MGIFTGISEFLYIIGGSYLSGFLQVLLMQSIVPFAMFFSLILLRYRGNPICRTARAILDKNNIVYTEIYIGDEDIARAEGENICRLYVNGRSIGDIPSRLKFAKPPDHDFVSSAFSAIGNYCCPKSSKKNKEQDRERRLSTNQDFDISSGLITVQGSTSTLDSTLATQTLFSDIDPAELTGEVLLFTDAHSWKRHLATFFSVPQYIGVILLMVGLIVTTVPELWYHGSTPVDSWMWILVFLVASIPLALSNVYKEIAFHTIPEMDVWYLNAWSVLTQFFFGMLYAPLAAKMVGLEIVDLLPNIWHGFLCLFGWNSITRDQGYSCVANDPNCATFNGLAIFGCCDSCDGSLADVSLIPAGVAVLAYVIALACYNTFFALVTKHGSASLAFVSASTSLPLASITFAFEFIMGKHVMQPGQINNTVTMIGLVIVLLGLFTYGVIDMWVRRKAKEKLLGEIEHPYFGSAYPYEASSLGAMHGSRGSLTIKQPIDESAALMRKIKIDPETSTSYAPESI